MPQNKVLAYDYHYYLIGEKFVSEKNSRENAIQTVLLNTDCAASFPSVPGCAHGQYVNLVSKFGSGAFVIRADGTSKLSGFSVRARCVYQPAASNVGLDIRVARLSSPAVAGDPRLDFGHTNGLPLCGPVPTPAPGTGPASCQVVGQNWYRGNTLYNASPFGNPPGSNPSGCPAGFSLVSKIIVDQKEQAFSSNNPQSGYSSWTETLFLRGLLCCK